ncbi:MAG: SGNH/GDSL hydrolase family protein, partial [Lachnospiraceae bacterium]|nr:SGNH/GDSL hydrolase family protein [Lachnospiraceae bacterium]
MTLPDFTTSRYGVNEYRSSISAAPAWATAANPAQSTAANPASRTVFFGDSRTIDLFADSNATLSGELHDGILVFAGHGEGYSYMESVLNRYGVDSFDTLIVWMGANDAGNFTPYQSYYEGLLAKGKRLVLCTVGPTTDSSLNPWDRPAYYNANMIRYNTQLKEWSAKNGVKVIDLYSFIQSESSIRVDGDG